MSPSPRFISSSFLCVLLAACGAGSSTNTADIQITCQGSACVAAGIENYKNTSAQVWTYRNTSDSPVTVNVNFSNLAQGQELAYVFGNGYSSSIASVPSPGEASSVDGSLGKTTPGSSKTPEITVRNALQDRQDNWQYQNSLLERDFTKLLRGGTDPSQGSAASPSPVASSFAAPAPATGQPRSWIDSAFNANAAYNTAVVSTCSAVQGRNIVFWADAAAAALKASWLEGFENTVCGSNGAVARLSRLLGDVWGPTNNSLLIQDGSSLLDIDIVVLTPPKDTAWAGYFSSGNTFLSGVVPDSNEALALFINANNIQGNLTFLQSTLIHELTHMVSWYERHVQRGAAKNDTWLEEMLAMMSEDIITPVLVKDSTGQPYQKILDYRLLSYVNSGGGLSLVNWASLAQAGPYYGMAGGFGAYINRQYGLAVYKGLITDCTDIKSGWACLDAVIKKNGGKGVDEAFNQYGLTVFGLGDITGPSSKYGFPSRTDGEYVLAGLNLSNLKKYRPSSSLAVQSWGTGTHTYFIETANINIFSFTRRSIVIPPRSQLGIMIRQGSAT